jgi:hypothetical protein
VDVLFADNYVDAAQFLDEIRLCHEQGSGWTGTQRSRLV